MSLILASASPRRSKLMADAGYAFDIDPADVDETPLADESARRYVERLARNKAEVIAHRHPEATVLGADTIVTVDGVLLGKPADDTEAAAMLFRLSGRSHEVMTGVAVAHHGVTRSDVAVSVVTFRTLDRDEIEAYVATGEPRDKAGAYAIQGIGGELVESVDGAWDNVVGLPMSLVACLLAPACSAPSELGPA